MAQGFAATGLGLNQDVKISKTLVKEFGSSFFNASLYVCTLVS